MNVCIRIWIYVRAFIHICMYVSNPPLMFWMTMYVCMHVCVNVHMCVSCSPWFLLVRSECTYVCIHAYTYVYIHTCIHMYLYVSTPHLCSRWHNFRRHLGTTNCMYVCMYVCMSKYEYKRWSCHMYVCMCVCMYV